MAISPQPFVQPACGDRVHALCAMSAACIRVNSRGTVLRSVIIPCKNFFLLLLAPTCSFISYPLNPLPLSTHPLNRHIIKLQSIPIDQHIIKLQHGPYIQYNIKLPTVPTSDTTLNCHQPSQVLQTTGMSLNYHPESRDMSSGHMHSTPGTYDMPSGHILPQSRSHETDNMPSGYLVSPGTSGCTMLTCTIPITITFPSHLPYGRETYIRHLLPLKEEEHMQDSHMYIMDLEDPCDYPSSPASHDIHKVTPTDNPGCLPYERQAYTQNNSAASLMEGRHTQDRYPNRSSLLERQHTQTDPNPYC